jgi:hypothetical protein
MAKPHRRNVPDLVLLDIWMPTPTASPCSRCGPALWLRTVIMMVTPPWLTAVEASTHRRDRLQRKTHHLAKAAAKRWTLG